MVYMTIITPWRDYYCIIGYYFTISCILVVYMFVQLNNFLYCCYILLGNCISRHISRSP